MTYTLLNLVFLIPAAVFAWIVRKRIPTKPWLATLIILTVLTVVFDNLMIAVGLFYYSPETSSGITIGRMPIEDLSYTVFAVLVLPSLWAVLPRADRAGTAGSSAGGRRLGKGDESSC